MITRIVFSLALWFGTVVCEAATVSLTNLTAPGTSFHVNDRYRLVVTGTAGQPVTCQFTHDGVSGTGSFGNTDGNGQLIIESMMDASSKGSWTEIWFVGSTRATPSLSFTVAAACSALTCRSNCDNTYNSAVNSAQSTLNQCNTTATNNQSMCYGTSYQEYMSCRLWGQLDPAWCNQWYLEDIGRCDFQHEMEAENCQSTYDMNVRNYLANRDSCYNNCAADPCGRLR